MTLRSLLRQTLPSPLLRRLRATLRPDQRTARRVVRRLLGDSPARILAGPFKGMKCIGDGFGAEYTPKILGTYELEYASDLRARLEHGHDVFVDVGAAEGYFAVGFLIRNPDARCVAFELSADARRLLLRNATLNGVAGRLDIRGAADAATLNASLVGSRRPWVLCDCEGAECDILDPVAAPNLRACHIILEVHGNLAVPPESGQHHTRAMATLIQRRFGETHRIREIAASPRTPAHWPTTLMTDASEHDQLCAMSETRSPDAMWQVMEPRSPNLA